MDVDIEKLIREAEALIAETEATGFEAWCRAQGLNPEKVRSGLAGELDAEAERKANDLFQDDMADIAREVEKRAGELGLNPAPAAPSAAAARQRRRFGMV
jgi:hypothetical protein